MCNNALYVSGGGPSLRHAYWARHQTLYIVEKLYPYLAL